ncbi:MAG: hypothetical protein Q6373_002805 [Candidatus Sigynarchaeota archaeon]
MSEEETYGHRDDTRKMSFWVKKDLAEKWDAFCKDHGIRKTTLFIVAVNDYIRQHALDTFESRKAAELEARQAQLVEKLDGIVGKIAEVARDKPHVNDAGIRDRILKVLERGGIDDDALAVILGMDRGDVLDILSVMKQEKLVKQIKGVWHCDNQE